MDKKISWQKSNPGGEKHQLELCPEIPVLDGYKKYFNLPVNLNFWCLKRWIKHSLSHFPKYFAHPSLKFKVRKNHQDYLVSSWINPCSVIPASCLQHEKKRIGSTSTSLFFFFFSLPLSLSSPPLFLKAYACFLASAFLNFSCRLSDYLSCQSMNDNEWKYSLELCKTQNILTFYKTQRRGSLLPSGHEVHTLADLSQVLHEGSQDCNCLFSSGIKRIKVLFLTVLQQFLLFLLLFNREGILTFERLFPMTFPKPKLQCMFEFLEFSNLDKLMIVFSSTLLNNKIGIVIE